MLYSQRRINYGFLAIAALAWLATTAVVSAQATHVVQRVVDGDTVVLTDIGTVRLIGVDTPETVDPRRPVEAFGREASEFLKGWLTGQSVTLTFDQARVDRFGRTLGYLHLHDGTFVNAEIIRRGYGHAYTAFPFRHLEEFRALERDARNDQRGLWAGSTPAPPAVVLAPRPRCQAITQDGAQCKRNAQRAGDFCWQHARG